jgi:hypothetical protein
MKFRIKADATFTAQNIDDALLVLSKHFKALAEKGVDSITALTSGEISVSPVEPKTTGRGI